MLTERSEIIQKNNKWAVFKINRDDAIYRYIAAKK